MKHQTATLTGADLNAAVAMALGHQLELKHLSPDPESPTFWCIPHKDYGWVSIPNYAGDISVAWPIIKKHGISIRTAAGRWHAWFDDTDDEDDACVDDDPQVAALRRFVWRVLGEEVELP